MFFLIIMSSPLRAHMSYWALVLLYNLLLFVKYLFHITLVGWFSFYFHRELQRSFSNILNLTEIPCLCGILKLCWPGKRNYFSAIILEEFWNYAKSEAKCGVRRNVIPFHRRPAEREPGCAFRTSDCCFIAWPCSRTHLTARGSEHRVTVFCVP